VADVSLESIYDALPQNVLDWIVMKWSGGLLRVKVGKNLCSGDIVLPLLTLENSEEESVVVIIALWECDLVLDAIFSKLLEMGLFLFAKVNLREDQSLVLSVLESKELLGQGWLKIEAFRRDLVYSFELFNCLVV
jgi:hypothetical protein